MEQPTNPSDRKPDSQPPDGIAGHRMGLTRGGIQHDQQEADEDDLEDDLDDSEDEDDEGDDLSDVDDEEDDGESLAEMLEDDHGCGGGRRVNHLEDKDEEPEKDDRDGSYYEMLIGELIDDEEEFYERIAEEEEDEDCDDEEIFFTPEEYQAQAPARRPTVLQMPSTLSGFFENSVVQPFTSHPPTEPWDKLVRTTGWEYHKSQILDRGRTEFDEPFKNLPPADKVLLYCYYYMQMHVASTYHVYQWASATIGLPLAVPGTVLLDFGSGPLTLPVALAWHNISNGQGRIGRPAVLNYVGIEKSKAMTAKAASFAEHKGLFDRASRFSFVESFIHHQEICRCLDAWLGLVPQGPATVVLNFSYFFASHSVNPTEVLEVVRLLLRRYERCAFWIVYQNPCHSGLAQKWLTFKAGLRGFHEMANPPNSLAYLNITNRVGDVARINLDYALLRKAPQRA
jgi:hypothetical protein